MSVAREGSTPRSCNLRKGAFSRTKGGTVLQRQARKRKLVAPLRALHLMALQHASPGQVLDVHPLGVNLSAEKTSALFKSIDLEVMRLVLLAGKSLPPHKVPGEITIHCLEGSLDVELDDATVRLEAGELIFLAGNAKHGVKAATDASALVTIALKP
jgi:quercetin dioxygenase-like cupin family protein